MIYLDINYFNRFLWKLNIMLYCSTSEQYKELGIFKKKIIYPIK